MSKVAIVTDTGSDLSQAQFEQYGIRRVPLELRFGTETFLEGMLSLDEFWARVLKGPEHPATSQPATGLYEQVYSACIEQGFDVLCLCITSKHSGTYNSAYAAAQSFPGRVTVYDTLSLSLAQAYLAIVASKAAVAGESVPQIVERLNDVLKRTHMFIGLDTIEYLRRGGRANAIMPVLERVVRVLNIKPTVDVVEGQLHFLAVDRSHDRQVRRIRDEVAKYGPPEMLASIHTRCPDEAVKLAHDLSERLSFPFDQILIGEAGPVLSCHAGPGVVAAAIVSRK
jgi:DegV family protein with EDD domain